MFSRGTLMAAEVDERIRMLSGGRKGLRDALRYLVAWSARERRPFRVDELGEIFTRATGVDARQTVDTWLRPLDRSGARPESQLDDRARAQRRRRK